MKSRITTKIMQAAALLALLSLGEAMAQQPAQEPKNQGTPKAQAVTEKTKRAVVTKVIEVKHINTPQELSELANVISFWAEAKFSIALNLLTVRGDPEAVAQAEEMVKKLDVPRARAVQSLENVEIIAHLLGATDDGQSELGSDQNLERVVGELKKTFPYKGYRLLESVAARTRVGEKTSVGGFIPDISPVDLPPTFYSFDVGVFTISSSQDPPVIRLTNLRFNARVPVLTSPAENPNRQFHYQDVHINTEIDVREGDMVVVGKAGVQGLARSLFLVLTAKVVK